MQLNLQDAYLGQLKKENLVSVVYLVNGFQLKGLIKGFDNFTVFLENEGKIQMVYKHSITTINPIKAIHLNFLNDAFKGVSSKENSGSQTSAIAASLSSDDSVDSLDAPVPAGVREV